MQKKVKDLEVGDRVQTISLGVVTITSCALTPFIESSAGRAYDIEYEGRDGVGNEVHSGGDAVEVSES